MRLTRGSLTRGEQIALVLTIVLAALLYILGPSAYAAATGTHTENHGHIVPKYGTVQYEKFMADFEAEHGHPWDIQNEMSAVRNGALLIGQLVLLLLSIAVAFSLAFDDAKDKGANQYKGFPVDAPMTVTKAKVMYRTITGACQEGIEDFVAGLGSKLKDRYTVREMLEITKGQYGHEKLEAFFAV